MKLLGNVINLLADAPEMQTETLTATKTTPTPFFFTSVSRPRLHMDWENHPSLSLPPLSPLTALISSARLLLAVHVAVTVQGYSHGLLINIDIASGVTEQ